MLFEPARVRSRCAAVLLTGAALLPALILFRGALPESVVQAQDKVDFSAQIAPILKEHCYEWHGGVGQDA